MDFLSNHLVCWDFHFVALGNLDLLLGSKTSHLVLLLGPATIPLDSSAFTLVVYAVKHYPTIPALIDRGISVNVYDKLDGSNIRVEWKRKQGRNRGEFYKFGSRKQLLATDQGLIAKAPLLLEPDVDELERYLIDELRIDRCICYFELYGERSFAGIHHPEDEHRLALLDIEVYKRGFLSQKEYQKMRHNVFLHTPRWHGKMIIDHAREQNIRAGGLGTFEGVVCKARTAKDKYGKPIMFKVKNQAWIDKVKEVHKGNTKLLAELL